MRVIFFSLSLSLSPLFLSWFISPSFVRCIRGNDRGRAFDSLIATQKTHNVLSSPEAAVTAAATVAFRWNENRDSLRVLDRTRTRIIRTNFTRELTRAPNSNNYE